MFPLLWCFSGTETVSSWVRLHCLILQFTHQNSFQTIRTHNPLPMEHPNLQFDTIVQSQGSVSTLLIARCSSKLLVVVLLAKKNRTFCCSQSDHAVNKPAFFSQYCPQFSAILCWVSLEDDKLEQGQMFHIWLTAGSTENRVDGCSATNGCCEKKKVSHKTGVAEWGF